MSMMNVAAYGSSPYGYSGYGDWRNGQGNPADPEYGASGAYGTEDEMDGAYGAYGADDADDVNGADGADGIYSWKGQHDIYINEGSVNGIREMTLSVAPSSEIVQGAATTLEGSGD